MSRKLYIRTLRLPDERVRLGQDGRRTARRRGPRTDRVAHGRRRHPVQHLLGSRKGAGTRLPRSRPRARTQDRQSRAHHRRRRLRRQPGGRDHRRTRALRRRRVRPADAAPVARADRAPAQTRDGRRSTSAFRRSRNSTTLPPPRVDGPSAFVSIMEGCSKYCSFCVVPYTRGEEVSRPFDDVLTEVADLADQGVREVTLLGQNVNAYRGPMTTRATHRRSGDADRIPRRNRRPRAHPLYDVAPEGNDPDADRRLPPRAQAGLASAPAGAIGFRPHPRVDEARLYRASNTNRSCAACARHAHNSH